MDIGHHVSGGICLTRTHRFSIIWFWSSCTGELLLKSYTSFECEDDASVAGGRVLGSERSISISLNFGVDSGEWGSNKGQLEF